MKILLRLFLISILISLPTSFAHAEQRAVTNWVMPVTLNDDNTKVHYQYFAFGNNKSGRTQGVKGKVWLANSDSRSVRAQITIPTPSLEAITSSSLGLLGELLQGTNLPPVMVSIDKITNLCFPKEIVAGRPCSARMEGRAQFGSLSRPLSIPIRVNRNVDEFVVSGEGMLDMEAASQTVPIGKVIDSANFSFSIRLPS